MLTGAGWRSVAVLAACAVFGACAGPDAEAGLEEPGRFELFVLGIAQDGGVPHVGCVRACCEEARAGGRERYPASLAVHDRETGQTCLLEATPRIEPQLALLHELSGLAPRARHPVDAVLLTHAHIGHYLGLAQLGHEVASTEHTPVWVTPRFAEFLREHGPWSQLVEFGQIDLREVTADVPFEPLAGLSVRAIPVPHRDEFSDTVAFRIAGPRRTVLFVPDIDAWSDAPELLDELLEGVDVAYLDATFYDGSELPGRDLTQIRHPFVTDTMERLAAAARERPGRIRFIHLNHSNPLLVDEALRAALEARGFRVARRGERVGL